MKRFYKLMLPYVAPYKWHIAGNLLLNLFYIFFSIFSIAMIIPFLGILFDTQKRVQTAPELSLSLDAVTNYFNYTLTQIIETKGEVHALIFVSVFVVIAIFLKNFFFYIASYIITYMRNGVVRDIRNRIFDKLLALPLGYYSDERKGNLISRISSDAQELEWSMMSSLVVVFREPIMIITYLGTMVYISPQMTLFVLIMLPVSGGIVGFVGRTLRKMAFDAQSKLGEIISRVEETIGGLRIIKAFGAEEKVRASFHAETNQFMRLMNLATWRRDLASPMSEFLGVTIMAIVMYYGGSLVLSEENMLEPQDFIGYIAIFSQILQPAKSFSTSYYNILKGLASFDRINQILNSPNPIVENQGTEEITDFKGKIEFKNVTFAYNDEPVLKNINLTVEKGKTVALVGQSGSGKSTLVDLIPRFYDVIEGEILIDGVNIKKYTLQSLRALMGNVNQKSILFNDNIYNNIAFGVENATQSGVEEAAKVANAHNFIIETSNSYQTNIGDGGSKLSGGQQQRISIARAILKNPPILILDEATSALDTESERLVQDALTKLMQNRTSVVIAHRLSTIKNADEICVLQAGEIIERGKHEELIKLNKTYKKLYEMQML